MMKMKNAVAYAMIAATLGLGLAFAREDSRGEHDSDSDSPPAVTMDMDVEVLLLRAGVSPDALAAAGLASAGVQAALAAEQQDLEAATGVLAGHDAACGTARVEVDGLRRLVVSGKASDEEIARLQVAKVELEQATGARDAFLEMICISMCEHFSAEAGACLGQVADSKRWKTIPVTYRTQARSETEMIAIRNALAGKRTHEKAGLEVPEEVTGFLAALDSDLPVATAVSNCDACLPGVDALWQSVFTN